MSKIKGWQKVMNKKSNNTSASCVRKK